MNYLKAVLIENDKKTIQFFNEIIENYSAIVTVVSVNSTLKEALNLIVQERPDCIIMNCNKQNYEAIEQLKKMQIVIPKFIFMSGEPSDACVAFKYNAIDFLLKPLELNLLIIAFYRVMRYREMELAYQNSKVIQVNTTEEENKMEDVIAISSSDKINLVKIIDIIFLKAEGAYTIIQLKDGTKIFSSKNLGEYKQTLPQKSFFRIHHSYVINVKELYKIIKKDGTYCEFINGIVLPVAKRRQDEFFKFMRL
ncbi:DNA-binding response regulator [Flavobacterium sediminis]|uniref:DNA-binding response regulator n=1 Tax=Flavobacterium sediminis TaxID=2201181 RepID=A0A2U8QSD1_9FLAO|nr:response regulator transcription factor [Flavobacterium sediminis]AWM13019.1 DNA-binding response regulator [Flavobacterium sediminis]